MAVAPGNGDIPSTVTTILVVNPTAGRGRAAKLIPEARQSLEGSFGRVEVLETSAPGSGVEQVRQAVEAGAERIVVLGGDGTLHEAANGLLRAAVTERPPIAILPAGTGNDYAKMARTLGMPTREAVRRLATGSIRRFDVGVAWGEYFLNAVGIGFDAEVARVVSGWKRLTGMPAYLAAVFEVLSSFPRMDLVVESDGGNFTDNLLLLEVAIGPCVGGGFRLTPDARPDDGWFDLCAIRHKSMGAILVRLPLVMLGRHTGLRDVRMLRATRVAITSRNGPLHAQFDGELRQVSGTMEIRIEAGALPVLIAS
jgi:YegS/Rv2252/BmrU family lipid kinase